MMRRIWLLLLALALAGCASGRVEPERLSITARDAALEAETVARGWAEDAELRYVEGEGVRPAGRVFPGGGYWRFVYGSPARTDQLVVTVTPRAVQDVTRPPQSPPGFAVGQARLPEGWIDAPQALEAVRGAGGAALLDAEGAATSMLLVPLRPPQWVVRVAAGGQTRQWRVNARTGAVVE